MDVLNSLFKDISMHVHFGKPVMLLCQVGTVDNKAAQCKRYIFHCHLIVKLNLDGLGSALDCIIFRCILMLSAPSLVYKCTKYMVAT